MIFFLFRFLKGECTKEPCLLSHNVSLEKMPTCKYFLQGCCVRNDCPYLHKKLSDQEEICLDFLKGFCVLADQVIDKERITIKIISLSVNINLRLKFHWFASAKFYFPDFCRCLSFQCQKRHEYLCPDFESRGKCDKAKCPHPHRGSSNRQTTKKVSHELVGLEKVPTARYYGDGESSSSVCVKNEKICKVSGKSDIISISDSDDDENDEEVCGLMKRPKIGDLPSFIPI